MKITDRQKKLLGIIIEEYIKIAKPVSSQLIKKKYNFGICQSTIRNEMHELTKKGYLGQPHTSAGRVPSDKGYRFFVDRLLEKGFSDNFKLEASKWFKEEIGDTIKLIQNITKNLASLTSNLAVSYSFSENILWKEGWEEILREPEFKETKLISKFVELLKNFESEINGLKIDSGIQVYIGKENPFPRFHDFSIIISKCHFSKKEEGILAILGPKRMNYNRNIGLVNSLIKLLEKN